jgi:hypothetical protein
VITSRRSALDIISLIANAMMAVAVVLWLVNGIDIGSSDGVWLSLSVIEGLVLLVAVVFQLVAPRARVVVLILSLVALAGEIAARISVFNLGTANGYLAVSELVWQIPLVNIFVLGVDWAAPPLENATWIYGEIATVLFLVGIIIQVVAIATSRPQDSVAASKPGTGANDNPEEVFCSQCGARQRIAPHCSSCGSKLALA